MEGRWNWTDNGWYWDSDEPFGWATYHYGRWYNDDYYGWLWVPDDQWGPSWVEWRYKDDYIGWAPLPPYASFHADLGIHFSIGWHSNYRYWNFVGYKHFCDRRVNSFLIDDHRCERIFGSTRYRTNYYSDHDRIINGGIDRSFIERRGGYRIESREIRNVESFSDFNRGRSLRSDHIVSYRPSEREFGAARELDNNAIRRGEVKTSLERDKIVTRDKAVVRDNPRIESGRTPERGITRDPVRNQTGKDLNTSGKTERESMRRERQSIGDKNQRVEKQQRTERPQSNARIQRAERPQIQNRRAEPSRQHTQERPATRTENSSRSTNNYHGKSERDRK